MDWLTHLMVFEEVAYSSLDIAIPDMINTVGAELLCRFASPEIKERVRPSLISGKLRMG
jgi:hypothetical protein